MKGQGERPFAFALFLRLNRDPVSRQSAFTFGLASRGGGGAGVVSGATYVIQGFRARIKAAVRRLAFVSIIEHVLKGRNVYKIGPG